MSDSVVLGIATGVISLLGTVFTGYMAYALAKLNKKTQEQDKNIKEVIRTGDAVHTLVNSAMTQQLKIAAVALKRVADLTKDEGDIKASEIAIKALGEHERKQQQVEWDLEQKGPSQ